MALSSRSRGPRSVRLSLERLEDRTVPALVFDSAFHFGGDSLQEGNSVAADSSGNVYVGGYFIEQVELAPGQILFPGSGETKGGFVASYSASGGLRWAHQLGVGHAHLALDAGNNVYVTGILRGSQTFDGTTLTSQGETDVFLTKLNSAGDFLWATRFGSVLNTPTTQTNEAGTGVAVDAAGNVFTTGALYNELSNGGQRMFVSRHDTNGNLAWLKTASSSQGSGSMGRDVAVSATGAAWVTGYYGGTVDFNPGPGTFNLTSQKLKASPTIDAFVLKLDASGNFAWAGSMGGNGGDGDYGSGIAVDGAGDVLVTGYYAPGSNDFNPGSAKLSLPNAGGLDVFVVKLNANGGLVWGRSMGGPGWDFSSGVAVDSAGSVYTTGGFSASADFNPGSSTYNLTSAGFYDIFVSQLTSAANFAWAAGMGATRDDFGYGIGVDVSGTVFLTGKFAETVDFDPGPGTFDLTSANHSNGVPSHDVFVLKLVPPTALQAAGGAASAKAAEAESGKAIPFKGRGTGSAFGDFLFARGEATHLGHFVLSGSVEYTGFLGSPLYLSALIFRAADGSTLFVEDAVLTFDGHTATGTLTIIGGTGRFEQASGSIEVVLNFDGSFPSSIAFDLTLGGFINLGK